jgi:Na+/H+ antiporter NhaA
VVALGWANLSPDGYSSFWGTDLALRLGDAELVLDLQHWVNDGLMVFFFFVVGLEVKRELAMGELTDRRRATIPLVAAVAGLAVPALVFLAFNPTGEAAVAWGVVISTDTAFLLGVLALVGPACPLQLRVFLLTLAVADDVGALTIIALFYTDDLAVVPLLLAVAGVGVMLVLRRLAVWRGPAYFVVAVVIWIAMEQSGVHPTIAGVVIALLAHAGALGLDVERFEGDLRDGLHVVRVRDDTLGAEASGVRGTPTFFVGGRRHTAPTDAATLGRALDAMAAGEER